MLLSAFTWHDQVCFPDLAHEGTPVLAVVEVLGVPVDEPDVVFAPDQNDGRVGTELADLCVPEGGFFSIFEYGGVWLLRM